MGVIDLRCAGPAGTGASKLKSRYACRRGGIRVGAISRRQLATPAPADPEDADDEGDDEAEEEEDEEEGEEAEGVEEVEDADPIAPGIQEAPESEDEDANEDAVGGEESDGSASSSDEEDDAEESEEEEEQEALPGAEEPDSEVEDNASVEQGDARSTGVPVPGQLGQGLNDPNRSLQPADPNNFPGSNINSNQPTTTPTALPITDGSSRGGMSMAVERSITVLITMLVTLLGVWLFFVVKRKLAKSKEEGQDNFFTRRFRPSAARTDSSRGTLWGGGRLWSRMRGTQVETPAPLFYQENMPPPRFISDDTSTIREGRLDYVRRSLLAAQDLSSLQRVHHPENSAVGPNPFSDPPEVTIKDGEVVVGPGRNTQIADWRDHVSTTSPPPEKSHFSKFSAQSE